MPQQHAPPTALREPAPDIDGQPNSKESGPKPKRNPKDVREQRRGGQEVLRE
ncbi:hypothetical protein GCM10022631_11240 [Deinococcus rubellus]|uniref:hypothetical protein n=1 Tax=Deinococcus rubellus TaxID=1889240 RepID=UPI0031F062B4